MLEGKERRDSRVIPRQTASLGRLKGRGYAGGSACILLNNFESSPAELFYRPPGSLSSAGARSSGAKEVGAMRIARFPSVAADVPSTGDWAKITAVHNRTLTVSGTTPARIAGWAAELAAGNQLFAHGLWAWNWRVVPSAHCWSPLLQSECSPVLVLWR